MRPLNLIFISNSLKPLGLIVLFILSAFQFGSGTIDNELKRKAWNVLATKCNSCHRKQNPFMVFNERNMNKRASKIYKAVFIQKRMPKGKENKLSEKEYLALQQWILTLNIE